jgi:hypothetical protein
MSTQVVDDLTNAANGIGRTIDVAAELGNGSAVIPHGVAVAESTITAGAVQLQSGTASAAGIAWTNVGSPASLNAGQGANLTSPGGAVAFIRAVITTPVAGGKCTVVITA